jgi:hypothetical protein
LKLRVKLREVEITGARALYSRHDRSIRINLETDLLEEGRVTHMPQFPTFLLHEILHAFLGIYSCRCCFCVVESEKCVGRYGHSPS